MLRRTLVALTAVALLAPLASAQTVDELIEKNIKAKGGMAKIKSVSAMKMTGKMIMGQGMEAPFVQMMRRPNQQRTEFTFQGMTGVQAFDGKTGWMVMPFMGKKDPEMMTEEDSKQLLDQSDFDGPMMNYKDKGNKVELVGKEQVEGTDAYKLKVTLKSGTVRYVYLDAEYFLEIKAEGKRTTRGTELEYESNIGDYKEVDGMMIAHSLENGAKGSPQKQKIVIEKVELNPVFSDTLFAVPANAKPAAPPVTAVASDSTKAAAEPAADSAKATAKPATPTGSGKKK